MTIFTTDKPTPAVVEYLILKNTDAVGVSHSGNGIYFVQEHLHDYYVRVTVETLVDGWNVHVNYYNK